MVEAEVKERGGRGKERDQSLGMIVFDERRNVSERRRGAHVGFSIKFYAAP